jgi:hypothetical protein
MLGPTVDSLGGALTLTGALFKEWYVSLKNSQVSKNKPKVSKKYRNPFFYLRNPLFIYETRFTKPFLTE